MANSNLKEAKAAKNDEFYTQFHDIEVEMNAYLEYDPNVFRGKTVLLPCDDPEWSNFTRYFAAKFDELGLKKLISTSYAPDAKKMRLLSEPTLFEIDAPQFDPSKAQTKGKIFILDKDLSGDGRINIDDLHWEYLNGDGDFRSKEVSELRDEADIIITNPPFSLFREFLAWIVSANKKFIIIGNMNAVTYKETFPLIKENKMWMGYSIHSGDREFEVPDEYPLNAAGWRIDENGRKFIRVKGVRWFTNIDHGRRHEPLPLMTMADNLRFSRHKEIKGKVSYDHYDNYDAISQSHGGDTVDSNISSMITVSDNDAANTLVNWLGNGDNSAGMAKVNGFCQEHGFTSTQMNRLLLASKENGDNYTSVKDCGTFLKQIYQTVNGTLPASTLPNADAMYYHLKMQQRKNKIPAQLPEGVGTANKTGELDTVENDAAIIYDTAKGIDLVVCFMSQDLTDTGAAQSTIAADARAIYGYYNE